MSIIKSLRLNNNRIIADYFSITKFDVRWRVLLGEPGLFGPSPCSPL